MKLKLTLVLAQINKAAGIGSTEHFKILVGDDDQLPCKYVTTKTIDDTLKEIHDDWCFIDVGWNFPELQDLRHEEGSTESEAVYYCSNPAISGWNKKGKLVNPNNIELEAFYESIIIRQPRNLY